MRTTPEQRAELMRLHEAAFPGEWQAIPDTSNGWEIRIPLPNIVWRGPTEIHGATRDTIAVCIEPWSRFTPPEYVLMVKNSFRVIAASHNALHDLLADLKDLERERENDWTASLCDRLNSFLREHPKAGNECKDGPTACDLVDALHGYAGSLVAENARMQEACIKTEYEVQQILGKALGYPWYKDDQQNWPNATESDGICVGEHVAASLAMEAADSIKRLREHFDRTNINNKKYEGLGRLGDDWPMACCRWKREAERLREACKRLLERFDDMYDGAPDSRCGWMVPFIDELRKATNDKA